MFFLPPKEMLTSKRYLQNYRRKICTLGELGLSQGQERGSLASRVPVVGWVSGVPAQQLSVPLCLPLRVVDS